eukprot:CAMPEP_0202894902 /NCGR_PEP_ID=MMETSP1392-20130828/4202_1 /ASSEMBLY_ACC=CAM_ASM_000868 /TAXON_ID=225041 /ORGANISM="Chlamydomonas chlamydogama, Strain SAG 11-48b" /LENGTH=63 /DNA_ID=CAMNT_0049579739 /DNA_START=612 /DNA_END=800 /DNA_ORIENTATION=+
MATPQSVYINRSHTNDTHETEFTIVPTMIANILKASNTSYRCAPGWGSVVGGHNNHTTRGWQR